MFCLFLFKNLSMVYSLFIYEIYGIIFTSV
nr:MAG TPA: hypothetical protein [Bacteriophage sp.]